LIGRSVKILVDGQPGAQRAGLGDGIDVHVQVGRGNGTGVIGEVLEEPAQIGFFLSGDEQLRQIGDGLEAHVPQKVAVRRRHHGLLHDPHPRQRHLHDAEGADLTGCLRRVGVGEDRTPVVAKDGHVPQAQVLTKGGQVRGDRGRVIARGRLGRVAATSHVRRDHLVLAG
jgi:hypothetical protein